MFRLASIYKLSVRVHVSSGGSIIPKKKTVRIFWDTLYFPVHMALYALVRSFCICESCVPLVPSKFIWKFAKFVLYQRSLSPQSLVSADLYIRNTCIVTIVITQLLFTHVTKPNSPFLNCLLLYWVIWGHSLIKAVYKKKINSIILSVCSI